MLRRLVVVSLMLAVFSARDGVRADSDSDNQPDGELWEINVSGSIETHSHHHHTGLPQETFDSTASSSATFTRLERKPATYTPDGMSLGGDADETVLNQGAGSLSSQSHSRHSFVTELEERWDSAEAALDGGGSTFLFDKASGKITFEAGAPMTGTAKLRIHQVDVGNQINRTDTSSGAMASPLIFNAETGQPGVTITKTKKGWALDWEKTSTSKSDDGEDVTIQRGHATVQKYSPLDEIELVIEPDDYDDWIPQGGLSETTPGNMLPVRATLRLKNGKTVPDERKAVRIRFELVHVSSEPGVAMNYPLSTDPDAPPDLQFGASSSASILTPAKFPHVAVTPDSASGMLDATARIDAYDYGAWGRLHVTADLEDGEIVVGHLAGAATTTEVLLPKRNDKSHIADAWKRLAHVADGVEDGDDREELAVADVHNPNRGDGFTLYEEYRGFIESGDHTFGDPARQDVFVVDETDGGRVQDADALLAGTTGMNVHGKALVALGEMPESRVMNVNYLNVDNHSDQHALVVYAVPDGASNAGTAEGGTPVDHPRIEISDTDDLGVNGWKTVVNGTMTVTTDEYALTVSHELLHGMGVWHHGDSDPGWKVWTAGKDAAGAPVIFETDKKGKATTAIKVLRENGSAVPPETFAKSTEIWLSTDGGQHSGFENCLMRYDVGQAYVKHGAPDTRYFVTESSGIGLCTVPNDLDAGENGKDHKPQPRYGDATKGSCFQQIHVSDRKGS